MPRLDKYHNVVKNALIKDRAIASKKVKFYKN
jgi:hypothetical protein